MILCWLIGVLTAGGALAWYAERWGSDWPRKITLAALILDSLLVSILFIRSDSITISAAHANISWIEHFSVDWIPRFGVTFQLALDGLSLLLIALTVFLGFMATSCSWTEINQRVGFFHFNLLLTLAGVVGVFLAMDLLLFFVFWEVMIIPMYFLISIWGHENRHYAAVKFFIFTQISSLLMLLSILGLVFFNFQLTGAFDFDYFDLLNLPLDADRSYWLMLGFFIAFVVKLPAVPFHTWLPDAHTQAPTAGSVILAGILLKTGAYGLLRFVVPLFPEAALEFTPVAMTLGVVSILYGGKLAFAQTDIKRLIAYTSISHMGFILLGVFAWNAWALQGVVMTMLAHGISSAALFMIAGALQERIHTRDMQRMGGLWGDVPRLSAIALFFSIAALGMPGLGNFIGEFLVLLGAFQLHWLLTAVAALGLIIAPIYSLIVIQKAFHGQHQEKHQLWDFGAREMAAMGMMVIVMVWMGLYPQSMLNIAGPTLQDNLHRVSAQLERNP
jgi:NADH-quinone oxidoreductase subunit M